MSRDEIENEVITAMERQLPWLLTRLVADAAAASPTLRDPGPELVASIRHAAAAELRVGLKAYELRRLPEAPPTETADTARLAARAHVPLAALQRVYSIAQNIYWETMYDAIVALDAPAAASQEVTRDATRFMHQFTEQISALATNEYTDERDRMLRRRMLRRSAGIRDLLQGTTSDDAFLDYQLSALHVGVIASGIKADEPMHLLRTHPQLHVLEVSEDHELWMWASGPKEVLSAAMDAVAEVSETDARLGVGRPAYGLGGFRTTHHQARSAHRLAALLERSFVRHRDVALEAFAGDDLVAADQFVRDELGPLLADPQHERALSTLRAYLDTGLNGASAAARLGISPRAVSHRINGIECLLDERIADRAAELQTALRLRDLVSNVRAREGNWRLR